MKISPLRAGLEAFNKLKNNEIKNTTITNPFSFKSKAIQFDVFELSNSTNKLNEFLSKRLGIINNLKEGAISFMGKARDVLNTKIELHPFKYSVANLEKQPVSELKAMLKAELKGI